MPDPADSAELVDVQMHQLARPGVFIAPHGPHRFRARSRANPRRARQFLEPGTGSVTVMQRAGSGLNLDLRFHTLVPDGVFAEEPGRTGVSSDAGTK